MLLAIPFTVHAQKSYVHIYVTEALKLSESHHSGSTMYLTGDIPSGLKDYYYYFNDDIPPHESDYDIYQINDDTRSIKFKIIEVTFSDKKKWKP